MKNCKCGASVTDDYHRVFSIGGVLHACPECQSRVGNDYSPNN